MRPRVPIDKQITAVRTMLSAARQGKKFKGKEIEFIEPPLMAAIETLQWVADHADAVKAASAQLGEQK